MKHIYECALIIKTEADEASTEKIKNIITETVSAEGGEVLLNDDWGVRTFAQPFRNGSRGHYYYFIYSANGSVNKELERRFRISENLMRHLIVKLGEEGEKEAILKNYKNPNHDGGNDDRYELEKDRKTFSKRRSCWFSEKKTQPDWKDVNSYSWLVNEFGKISPARVTGLRPGFQRKATAAIKRGRCMGMISYLSNQVANRG